MLIVKKVPETSPFSREWMFSRELFLSREQQPEQKLGSNPAALQ